jgi:hypothetical protein
MKPAFHIHGVAALVAALFIVDRAHAQNASELTECQRYERIIAWVDKESRSDIRGLNAVRELVPTACESVRQSISRNIAFIEALPEWRAMGANGSITAAIPPSAPTNAQNWPAQLTPDMMLLRPSEEQIWALHPVRARERGRFGAVIMEGRALPDGSFVWRIISASPVGWGFEDAALRVGALYRAPPTLTDGRTTVGAVFQTVVGFTAPSPKMNFQD